MALTTTNSSVTYQGNGSQTAFLFPYKFTQRSDLRVTKILADGQEKKLTLGADYTVDPDGGSSGTVTLAVAPLSTERVWIQRVVSLTQPLVLPIQGPIDPLAIEAVLDRAFMALQQLAEGVGVHFHGIEPGGNLHALVTESEHGFFPSYDYVWVKQHQGSGIAHNIDQINELREILDDIQNELILRAPVVHGHPISAITGLQTSLNMINIAISGKADIDHIHPLADVEGQRDGFISWMWQQYLESIPQLLDQKEPVGAPIPWNRIVSPPTTIAGYGIGDAYTKTQVDTALSGKSDIDHSHPLADVELRRHGFISWQSLQYLESIPQLLDQKEPVGAPIAWTRVINKPVTLSGYGIGDAYTKSEVNTALAGKEDVGSDINWSRVVNRPTTLSGYGIGDAFTKTEVNSALSAKANSADVFTKTETTNLLEDKANVADVYTKVEVDNALEGKEDVGSDINWSRVVQRPTNLTGYGITDAYTKTEVDNALSGKSDSNHSHPLVDVDGQQHGFISWQSQQYLETLPQLLDQKEPVGAPVNWNRIVSPPTTIAGYGIGDAYTKTEVNTALALKANTEDTYTKTEVDTALAGKSDSNHSHPLVDVDGQRDGFISWQSQQYLESLPQLLDQKEPVGSPVNWTRIVDPPTTISGFGITDAYTKTQTNALIANKADVASTLAGYGITNAYTKTEVNTLLSGKADKSNTLAGYGITNAYTKTETNTLLSGKADKATTLSGYGINDAYTKGEIDAMIGGNRVFHGVYSSGDGMSFQLFTGDAGVFPGAATYTGDVLTINLVQPMVGTPILILGPTNPSETLFIANLRSFNGTDLLYTVRKIDEAGGGILLSFRVVFVGNHQ